MQARKADIGASQKLERYARDRLYFDKHREKLLRQYSDQWVAVYNQQVVGAAKDPEGLVEQLEGQGIDPGYAFRWYLTDEDVLLIV